MVRRHNFECERDTWIGIWKKHPESACVSQKDMKLAVAVQALSGQMQAEYGCNLQFVSNSAIFPYLRLDDSKPETAAFKKKVFDKIVKTIKADKDPFTGKSFSDLEFGITTQLIKDIIKCARTGVRPTKRVKKSKLLTQNDIELLDSMRICVMSKCKSEDERDKFLALYKKIRGI